MQAFWVPKISSYVLLLTLQGRKYEVALLLLIEYEIHMLPKASLARHLWRLSKFYGANEVGKIPRKYELLQGEHYINKK